MKQILHQLKIILRIKGKSPLTEKSYVRHIKHFLNFVKKSNSFTLDDIIKYQYFISEKVKYSVSYFNQCSAALRFLFQFILKPDFDFTRISIKKRKKTLPSVLNKQEIAKIFEAAWNIRYKAMVYTLYSAGLRVSEIVNLRIKDIDSQRMVMHIHETKYGKDRIALLSPSLLEILRKYYRKTHPRPKVYLFEGMKPGKPMCRKSINYIVDRIVSKTDIKKNVTVHTFRHTFATHLLENGANLRIIQVLLGHSDISTTSIYMHVAKDLISNVKSPLDNLLETPLTELYK